MNDSDHMSSVSHGRASETLSPGSDAKIHVLPHPFAERLKAQGSSSIESSGK